MFQKSSIFTKVRQFHLPIQNDNLQYKNYVENLSTENDINDSHNITRLLNIKKTDTLRSNPENILNTDDEEKRDWNTNAVKINAESTNVHKTKHPNNLLQLLDKLEKRIRNIELTKHEKLLIEAKIRQIYGSVIGHENLLLNPNPINHHTKVESHNDIKYKNKDNQYDINFDSDYYLDDDNIYQTNHNKNLRALDRPPNHDRNNMNIKDSFKQCTERNNRLNCNIAEHAIKIYQSKSNLGLNKNNVKGVHQYDKLEEFGTASDREFDRRNHYQDKERNYRKTKTLNGNLQRKENLKYNYKISDDLIDMQGPRQHYSTDADIKSRNIYKTPNLRSRPRNVNRGNNIRSDRYRLIDTDYDDPLGPERRKYYQDKLEKLQRQIQERQHYVQNKKVKR